MNKTVVITGASSGYGEACAERFSETAETLILLARRIDRLEDLADRLRSKCQVHVASVDVTSAESIDGFVSEYERCLQEVDVLVNSAGLALGLEAAYETNIDDWETMVDTNIKGLMRMTRCILPFMVKRNTGHIINIGSTAGSWPYPGSNVYGASKAFVQQFTRGLRADLLGKNIRVTNIEPGLSKTEFSTVRFKGDVNKANDVYENTEPLKGEDIAEIVSWVVSLPHHVNINALEVMPTCQAWTGLAIDRNMT